MYRLLGIAIVACSLLAEDATLELARRVNLDRAANMPNFVADEFVTHFVGNGGAAWRQDYTVQDEITVRGNQISRRNAMKNGQPWDGRGENPVVALGLPATGFAAALQPLFDPHCPTTLEPAGHTQVNEKDVMVYSFRSPKNGCFGNLYGGRPYNAARDGRIFVDPATGDLLQFQEEATGFPKDYLFRQRNQIMIWDQVKIGDATHWLPVSADFVWLNARGNLFRAAVEYKNHRHFEAASDLNFK